MNELIRIEGLGKTYPGFALREVSLSLPGGSIMGLIGENGAGKTTILKSLLGLVRPESGRIELLGRPVKDEAGLAALKQDIGVVLADSFFYEGVCPADVASVLRSLYPTWDDLRFKRLMDRLELPLKKPVKTLSRGNRMKFCLVTTLAHRPRLLLLDEATSGLDPLVRGDILDLFLEFIEDEDHGILLSSHITTDLERVADYITLLHKGRVELSRSKDELLYDYGIVKGTASQIAGLDCLRRLSHARDCQGLVANREECARRHPELVVDRATLDEIMEFYVRGKAQ